MSVADYGLFLLVLAGWGFRETLFLWWQRAKKRIER